MKYKNTFKRIFVALLSTTLGITGISLSCVPALAGDLSSETTEAVTTEAVTTEAVKTEEQEEIKNDTKSDAGSENDITAPETVESDTSKQDDQTKNDKIVKAATLQSEQQETIPETTSGSEPAQLKSTSGTGATDSTEKSVVLNGWQLISGKYYYYKNNVKYTGWHYMTKAEGEKINHWSYFGNDGVLRTGWVQLGKGTSEPDGNSAKHWSYFGDNGWLRTNWVQLGKGTSEPDGNSAKHWSYFGDNGWLRTNWVQLGKGTSNPDGNSAKHWSYFGENGWLRTNWVQLGKGTSNPDGNASRHWSYFGENGWLRTNWVQLGKGTSEPDGNSAKHWSYFGDNGWLRTYWQQLGKGTENPDGNSAAHYSYFGDNGWLQIGSKTIDGKSYTFDSKGWLIAGSISDSAVNLTSTGTQASQLIPNGCYRISPAKNTGYSFDVYGGEAGNGTKVWSYANNNTAAQFFQIIHLGNNIYSIKTGASIYASGLDISGGKSVAGASVVQNKYTGASTQKWKIVSAGNGYYTIKPYSGNLALDIEGGKLSQGSIKLAAPTGSDTQKFKLSKVSGFLVRNGRKYYFNENGDKPMIGIDVSAWSETVDWEKVKADGIEFAIIRASHRGGQVDRYAKRNMSECTRLGIPFGVYCYSYATNNSEADHEVDTLLSVIKGYNPVVGVFIDVEDNDTYSAAYGNIYSAAARRKITDITKRMIQRVQNAGYLAGVYANTVYMDEILYLDEMPNARWVARYYGNNTSDTTLLPLGNKGYKIWQFTSRGYVNGVPNSGDCDLNTLIEKYW